MRVAKRLAHITFIYLVSIGEIDISLSRVGEWIKTKMSYESEASKNIHDFGNARVKTLCKIIHGKRCNILG